MVIFVTGHVITDSPFVHAKATETGKKHIAAEVLFDHLQDACKASRYKRHRWRFSIHMTAEMSTPSEENPFCLRSLLDLVRCSYGNT